MQHISLLQPKQQIPSYNSFLNFSSGEINRNQSSLQKASYELTVSKPDNSSFTHNFSWEYNSSELEFE